MRCAYCGADVTLDAGFWAQEMPRCPNCYAPAHKAFPEPKREEPHDTEDTVTSQFSDLVFSLLTLLVLTVVLAGIWRPMQRVLISIAGNTPTGQSIIAVFPYMLLIGLVLYAAQTFLKFVNYDGD